MVYCIGAHHYVRSQFMVISLQSISLPLSLSALCLLNDGIPGKLCSYMCYLCTLYMRVLCCQACIISIHHPSYRAKIAVIKAREGCALLIIIDNNTVYITCLHLLYKNICIVCITLQEYHIPSSDQKILYLLYASKKFGKHQIIQ